MSRQAIVCSSGPILCSKLCSKNREAMGCSLWDQLTVYGVQSMGSFEHEDQAVQLTNSEHERTDYSQGG
jgi:hypothetical protein